MGNFISKKSIANSTAICASTILGYWTKDKKERRLSDHLALGAAIVGTGATCVGAAFLVASKIKGLGR